MQGLQQAGEQAGIAEVGIQGHGLVREADRQARRQRVVDLIAHRGREVGDALQRDATAFVARRVAVGVARIAQRLGRVDVGGEGELGAGRVDRQPRQWRHQQRHVGHAAEARQVHGRGQGTAVLAGHRVVVQAECGGAIVRRCLETSADVHDPGDQLDLGLAPLELGQGGGVVVHRVDAGGVGRDRVGHGHGLGVADGQVVGQLGVGERRPAKPHPCHRHREGRNAHSHVEVARRLLGFEALDIQGRETPSSTSGESSVRPKPAFTLTM